MNYFKVPGKYSASCLKNVGKFVVKKIHTHNADGNTERSLERNVQIRNEEEKVYKAFRPEHSTPATACQFASCRRHWGY